MYQYNIGPTTLDMYSVNIRDTLYIDRQNLKYFPTYYVKKIRYIVLITLVLHL